MGNSQSVPPKAFSIIDAASAQPGHGEIHRSIVPGGFPELDVQTLYDNFQLGVQNNKNGPCLGRRPIDAAGKAGPFEFLTYDQVNQQIQDFGSGLVHHGFLKHVDGMKMMAIYMKNRQEWVISAQGIYKCGGTTVPFYDTLGEESTAYILNQTTLSTVVCTAAELEKLSHVKESCSNLQNVIICGSRNAESEEIAKNAGLKLFGFEDVIKDGHNHPSEPTPGKAEDTATFMYTSGTTGNPKGAMLTHKSMLVCTAAVLAHAKNGQMSHLFVPDTVHLSYLPLPHIFETTVQICVFKFGGSVGFYQGSPLKIVEDLAAIRPTLFCSVPRLLNKIHDKIINGAQSGSPLKAALFNTALSTKLANLQHGITRHALWDALVFGKLRKKLGLDRCEIMITGSAPISSDVMNFLRVAFLCPVAEGYGQTEASCATNITHFQDLTHGHVGGPLPCCEIKLVSVSDMGYEVTDTSHGESKIPCNGRGEICFRGPSIFSKYYKLPDKTSEAVDEDGWLHSGDIGLWTPDGKLKIIDRKKNIFKLSQGEYVAPEKIENILIGNKYIAQAFVYGDSFHSHLVGIIVPDEDCLKALAKENNIQGDFKELCKNETIRDIIQKGVVSTGKESKLSGFETVRQIELKSDPFTVEANILTPTFKLRRNNAKECFIKDIELMYERSGDSIAGKNLAQS